MRANPLPRLLRGLLLGALCAASLHAAAAPTVSLAAGPVPAVAGGTLTLAVNAADVTDLYAWQLSVDFDPALFQARGATEGGFLSGAGATFFDGGTIDNVAGTVSFSFDTLVGAVPGATGSGRLESLTFDVLAGGTGRFSLRDVQLLDSGLGSLSPILASVTVAAVPEPASVPLLLAGLALLGMRGRRPR